MMSNQEIHLQQLSQVSRDLRYRVSRLVNRLDPAIGDVLAAKELREIVNRQPDVRIIIHDAPPVVLVPLAERGNDVG